VPNKYEQDPYSRDAGANVWGRIFGSSYDNQLIPESWEEFRDKAEMLSEEYGRGVYSVFEALWYPQYETAAETFSNWVDTQIGYTLESAEELRGFVHVNLNPTEPSIAGMGAYYRNWIEYAVRYTINEVLNEDPLPTEMELLGRVERVFNSIRAQAEGEVLDRLAGVKKQTIWYRTWLRPYLFRSVPATFTFYGLLRYVRAALLMVYAHGVSNPIYKFASPGVVAGFAHAQEAMVLWWERYRILLHVEDWIPKAIGAIRSWRTTGPAIGAFAAGKATAVLRGLKWAAGGISALGTGVALFFLTLFLVSFEVEAPEIDDIIWNDIIDEPEIQALQEEVRAVAKQAEELNAEIGDITMESLTDAVAPTSTLGAGRFTSIDNDVPSFSFDAAHTKHAEMVAKINALTIPSIGPEPMVQIKAQLLERLNTKIPSEAQASEVRAAEPEISDEEIMLFVNPMVVFEIVAPTLESMIEGRTDLTEEEFAEVFERAVARNEDEMQAYSERIAERIVGTRAIAVEAPTELNAVEAAVEGMEALQTLGLGESTSESSYQSVLMQMKSAEGNVPPGMEPKLQAGISAAQKILEEFNDSTGSATED